MSQKSKEEKISILKVATSLGCEALRLDAAANLEGVLRGMDFAILGRKFAVISWVQEGYRRIVSRNETITDEEVFLLGPTTTIRLLRLRDGGRFKACLRKVASFPWPAFNTTLGLELDLAIATAFKEEFDELAARSAFTN